MRRLGDWLRERRERYYVLVVSLLVLLALAVFLVPGPLNLWLGMALIAVSIALAEVYRRGGPP